ncbi:MAG: type II toxin-antitoxin system VapC family toxin [Rhodospirillaceae bacterium]
MRYLVDTNLISALAPSKGENNLALINWLKRSNQSLYLSVITTAEVSAGIAKAQRQGAHKKAELLATWWGGIEHLYGHKILPFDQHCAQAAGKLMDQARAHRPGFEDLAIAATAQSHGMTVLTRNLRHFLPLDVSAINPFDDLPD